MIYVCSERDIECGRNPASWCAKCPQRAPVAPLIPTEQPTLEEALADRDGVPYMIVFDDADRKPELVYGGTRAQYRFKEISASWNAHLFVKIKGNSADDKSPCYAPPAVTAKPDLAAAQRQAAIGAAVAMATKWDSMPDAKPAVVLVAPVEQASRSTLSQQVAHARAEVATWPGSVRESVGIPPLQAPEPTKATWQSVSRAGMVKVGDKLRFKIGDKEYRETAQQILYGGTDKEEVIYNLHENFYFITSMVVGQRSNHKGVLVRTKSVAPSPAPESVRDAEMLDWLEKNCTGASDSERYLPFRIYWGNKGATKGLLHVLAEAIAQEKAS